MQFHKTTALALIGLFGVAACDAGLFVAPDSTVKAPVKVTADVGSLSVGGVSVEVTGPGISQPIIANLPVASGLASGQVEVLSGSNRAFTVRAYDMQGMETHEGADTVNISGNGTQTLNISLSPLTGDVDLGARVGDYTITITLSSGTMSAGASGQATVTVVNAYGDTLPNPAVVWASSNPVIASVDSAGAISALVAGQTTIGATYQGFGGSATLTVQ